MPRTIKNPICIYRLVLGVLVLSILCLYSLDRTRLGQSIPDEKRYIQSTKEMVEGGDYVTPRYHGKLRFQKPILFYWLIILSYKIFGITIYGARFPSIVASIVNVILIYSIARLFFNKKAGFFAAAVLSTCEVFFMYARFASPDMVFLMFITAAMYFFGLAYLDVIKGRFKYLYMYACMALAMITKGPLGLIYPMATISIFFIVRKELGRLKEINLLPGLVLFTVISAPWFLVMLSLYGNEYFDNVWTLEIVKKMKYFTSGQETNLIHHYLKTFFYYIGMSFARHLPWSIFLPASFAAMPITRRNEQWAKGLRLIASWFVAVFIILILIWSKESYYVLGLSVPIALFLGMYLSVLTENDNLYRSILLKIPFLFIAISLVITIVLCMAVLYFVFNDAYTWFSAALLLVPFFMIYSYRKRKALIPVALFISATISFGYAFGYAMPRFGVDPIVNIAERLKDEVGPADDIASGSNSISSHRLNTVFDDYNVTRADRYYYNKKGNKIYSRDKKKLLRRFLTQKDKRVFLFITKEDYDINVEPDVKTLIDISATTYVWKRLHKEDVKYFNGLLTLLLKGEIDDFRRALKEEAYLVTNTPISINIP
ncbi:MAG: glycosyltransferase family 39 protein [Candidatus Omnitrophica bacterium]|nr:glycosyltransferase family 39 protein [Candidatus Omnitrophota bacterium]